MLIYFRWCMNTAMGCVWVVCLKSCDVTGCLCLDHACLSACCCLRFLSEACLLCACRLCLYCPPNLPYCSYKQVRQRHEFADRSIITMVEQHPNSSSSSEFSRELSQAAELDAFMLAEVVAVAQQGYSRCAWGTEGRGGGSGGWVGGDEWRGGSGGVSGGWVAGRGGCHKRVCRRFRTCACMSQCYAPDGQQLLRMHST
jgi:hypothetical protein